MGRVQGKVAIVTGAAKGLGEADARLLAREGATVIVTDIDEAAGRKVASELGNDSMFVKQDVVDEKGWVDLIDTVMKRYGKLHVLVNNAGIAIAADPVSTTTEQYRKTMAIHMDSTFFGCKYAIPAIAKSGGGSIINMSSIAAIDGTYMVAAYCAAKGAIRSYTKAVASYCAQKKLNIRCNSIHPAGIDTPMVRQNQRDVGAIVADRPAPAGPTSRLGEPNDIAWLVVYLASDESKFTSGAEIVVDNTITTTPGVVP